MAFVVNAISSYMDISDLLVIDPRTKDWFLVSSPWMILIILTSYLYFCTKAGPWFMEDRKPYKLKNTLIVYNFLQVLFSCYLFFETSAVWMSYDWVCEPLDFSTNPIAKRMQAVGWMYFFAKITELLDTIFFVLRKKYNQVTFLHLFHHTMMPFFSWIGLRYRLATGLGTFLGLINSFVHIIMYSYYLVAGLGPEYQKYLWWKKHLTGLQLVQFTIVFIQNLIALFTDCAYPKLINILILTLSSAFMYMFGSFYIKSYIQIPRAKNISKQH